MAGRKKKRKKFEWKSQLKYELIGLSLLILSVITFARLGSVGEVTVNMFRLFLGEWNIALTIGLFLTAMFIIVKRAVPSFFTRRLLGVYLLVFSFLLLSHLRLFEILAGSDGFQDQSVIRNTWQIYWLYVQGNPPALGLGGGMIGAIGFAVSHFLFDSLGTYLISFFCFIVSIILITGQSLTELITRMFGRSYHFVKQLIDGVVNDLQNGFETMQKKWEERKAIREQMKEVQNQNNQGDSQNTPVQVSTDENEEPIIYDFTSQAYGDEKSDEVPSIVESESADIETDGQASTEPEYIVESEVQTNKDYQLPSFDLLSNPKANGQHLERQNVSANARKLEQTLESFGVKAKVLQVHLGPAVTKYEVHPHVGVKVSKIVNLSDDLALALAAKDIRIEAPIPGKSAIGIEVPNKEVAIVTLREVLDSPQNKKDSVLSVGLGRDISGEPVLAELNKMPHLLVAGATGSGKSVCINGIITSILMKAKPHEVKLMMIDPKMVELTMYNGVPHLLTPVVTEPKKASQALKKVVSEMERRYDLFSHSGTRNIEGYNELIRRQNETNEAQQPFLPFIVVIVDELADLMMVASGDVEDSITRLAQMARAAGIHMIIATQRPSVDVITGVIKANIPSRIAFGVSSQIDSRTILDSGGAEKLLGRGDMLYLPVGASKPTRIQGAFLSDEEVESIVDFVIAQQKAQYQEEMMPTEVPQSTKEVEDDLYLDAVDLVMEMNTASVSMLQRRFRIGYTRAARLIDEMEARGIVGPYEGSKPREVLVQKPLEEEASSQ
ncbi:DNA translocase FtsK [Bacillus sp. FJAT-45350]|uniref:DNA translocase FtsK n=1 Tax=Bacillus sp. FJAT-45350 TaxID=2011014 RepID=UPI000BB77BA0|nr:DNA translocase FtsK [Bacillus sp. FJAT-45350]